MLKEEAHSHQINKHRASANGKNYQKKKKIMSSQVKRNSSSNSIGSKNESKDADAFLEAKFLKSYWACTHIENNTTKKTTMTDKIAQRNYIRKAENNFFQQLEKNPDTETYRQLKITRNFKKLRDAQKFEQNHHQKDQDFNF